MRVIGISGPDGCGKSTLAEAIMSNASDRFRPVRIAFAEVLRDEVQLLLERDGDKDANAWQKPTPDWLRNLLRGWGDYKRSQSPDYWVKSWQTLLQIHIRRRMTEEFLVIADDIRYTNEAEAVHNLGGTVLYLDDAAVPDHQLLHELLDVREMADIGFTVDSRAGNWAEPQAVMEALGL